MAVKRSRKKAKKATVKHSAKRAAKKTIKRAKRAVKWSSRSDSGPRVAITKIAAKPELAMPRGFGADPNTGLITPKAAQAPIKASKLKKGLQDARKVLDNSIAEIMAPSDDYDIKEIELSLTFGVKGEFLGFGGSGGTSVKVRIGPPSGA